MNVTSIQDKLEKLLERYSEIGPLWAEAKTLKEKLEELKKTTLAVIATNTDGESEKERERLALKSKKYLDYIDAVAEASTEFYKIDHENRELERQIDVYRSFLSYEKSNVDLHV